MKRVLREFKTRTTLTDGRKTRADGSIYTTGGPNTYPTSILNSSVMRSDQDKTHRRFSRVNDFFNLFFLQWPLVYFHPL